MLFVYASCTIEVAAQSLIENNSYIQTDRRLNGPLPRQLKIYMTIKCVNTNSWACFVQYVPMQYMLILRSVKYNSQILTSEALLRFDFCGGLIFGERKRRKETKMEVN